jgi:hypothetical protein
MIFDSQSTRELLEAVNAAPVMVNSKADESVNPNGF